MVCSITTAYSRHPGVQLLLKLTSRPPDFCFVDPVDSFSLRGEIPVSAVVFPSTRPSSFLLLLFAVSSPFLKILSLRSLAFILLKGRTDNLFFNSFKRSAVKSLWRKLYIGKKSMLINLQLIIILNRFGINRFTSILGSSGTASYLSQIVRVLAKSVFANKPSIMVANFPERGGPTRGFGVKSATNYFIRCVNKSSFRPQGSIFDCSLTWGKSKTAN